VPTVPPFTTIVAVALPTICVLLAVRTKLYVPAELKVTVVLVCVGLPNVTPAGPDCRLQFWLRLPPAGRTLSVTVPVRVAVFVGSVIVWKFGLMVTVGGWLAGFTVTVAVVDPVS